MKTNGQGSRDIAIVSSHAGISVYLKKSSAQVRLGLEINPLRSLKVSSHTYSIEDYSARFGCSKQD